jgi:formylglycine-generating enzyme required for sulfatase activity
VFGAVAALALLAGCRLFVDLDGVVGDPDPRPDGGSDATDAAPSSDASDVEVQPDVPALPDGGCPSKGGPAPLRITSGGVTFCMDTTQVSNAHYDAFLQSAPSIAGQPASCTWNTSFLPSSFPYPSSAKDLPVFAADWCDAYAFCAWAGKRLCGRIGGGAIGPGEADDPTKSERMMACTKNGTRAYPYGNTYVATACNGTDKGANRPLPVGSQPTCQGGFDGLFDLSGNAHEWLGICDSAPADGGPSQGQCVQTGSSWTHGQSDMACNVSFTEARSSDSSDTGFRCCSN